MSKYKETKDYLLINDKMQNMFDYIEKESVEAIITDPPYELGFMGKSWDSSGVAFQVDTWKHCYDALKPGGYLLAFGGSRTYHRICCAIEDAGFEIRDCIMWLYGSGFPKSMNISKGLEAKEKLGNAGTRNKRKIEQSCEGESYSLKQTNNGAMGEIIETTRKDYVAGTELAKQWEGWGTCLKPAYEPIIVARKPFKGSLVDNVIDYGVGGLNIDECRLNPTGEKLGRNNHVNTYGGVALHTSNTPGLDQSNKPDNGRFPANVILTYDETDEDEVCGGFPDTSPTKKHSGDGKSLDTRNMGWGFKRMPCNIEDNGGSAARYFYCAKASKKDRDEGLDAFEAKTTGELQGGRKEGSAGSIMLNADGTTRVNPYAGTGSPKKNIHPTVKPVELMQYLVRLVAPKGSTVMDCFMGSGSTGKAVMFENREREANYKFVGIELTDEYLPICESRVDYALNKYEYDAEQETIRDHEEGRFNIFDFMD